MDNKQNDTEQVPNQTPPATSDQDTANATANNAPAASSETIAAPETTTPETPISSAATHPSDMQQAPVVPIPSSTVPPVGAAIAQPPQKKSKAMLFMMIIILLIIIAAGAYFFYMKAGSHSLSYTQGAMVKKTTMIPVSKPTTHITPITPANVDQTLNTTDATMQQAMNQADADLNSVNQIDTTQDSTTGL